MLTKFLVVAAAVSFNFIAIAAPKANPSADAQAANTACSGDAATAGCGNEKVGTGLLKCIGSYRKTHKEWKPSDACQAAMKTLHSDSVAVNNDCSADSQTAGCGSAKVGTGLIACLRKYQKNHKDFQFSTACSAALAKETGRP